jgi:hypothetical protein
VTLLALALTRSAGLGRAALVAVCTALVSALLLVAVALLRLPAQPSEALVNIVADPGVRAGTLLGIALLTLPPLLLLHQAVRLGTSARERRLAGLRLAGATPGDVRRIGAVEVGAPALVGGLGGIVVYLCLRKVLGGADPRTHPAVGTTSGLHLVPTTVGPSGWQLAAVVVGVGAIGALVGWWGSPALAVSPVGVARRQPLGAPKPWGAALLLLAFVLLAATGPLRSVVNVTSTGYGVTMVGLAVVGMTGLASSAAYWTGRVAEREASSAPALLAARRLVTDPRPAGRAAAAVGGIALVSGGTGVLAGATVGQHDYADADFTVSLAIVAGALLVALTVVVGSLAVHSTETILDQKRSMAALVAQGTSPADLVRSQRMELVLASLPVAVLGVVLGSVVLLFFGGGSLVATGLVMLGNLVLTPALVILAAVLATALTRPLLRQAVAPEHLRTE